MAQPQGMFDWNYQDPRLLQQQYAQQGQISPADMAAMPLLNQVAAMGSNAGANIGVGLGRMFGGRAPQEIENEVMKDVFTQAAQATADPIERLQIAAQGLRQKGMEGRAVQLERQMFELMESQGKAQESQAKAASEMQKQSQAAQRLKGLTQFIQRKMPDLAPEEAAALASDEKVVQELLKNPEMKPEFIDTAEGQLLVDKNTGKIIAQFSGKPQKPSMGSEIASGLAPLVGAIVSERAKKAGGAEGTEVGKATAQIGAGYKSLDALQNALGILEKGIYAGGYGPVQEMGAKYGMGIFGDRQRLVNTQEYRSYIKQVVMPMMAMLGGSDSNEELKKMEEMMAAETSLDPKAMQNIINNAMKAVRKDLARIEKQQEAVSTGTPLPTGPIQDPQKKTTTRTTRSGVKYTVEED